MNGPTISTGALAAGRRHSVARRRDGTVLAAGNGGSGECAVGQWTDVIAVAADNVHAQRRDLTRNRGRFISP